METLTLTQPDDWHVHVRDGALLNRVVADTARQFARAIIMPNLKPPVVTVAQAAGYRARILAALPAGSTFQPLMTLYLTDHTTPQMITEAAASGWVQALKYYPAGATTNADSGVTALEKVLPALARMAEAGLPLLVHGEVTDSDVDVFDREKVFIEKVLHPLAGQLPQLKIVLEHITTRDAVEYVSAAPKNITATITAHHLLLNRNAMFAGGVRPHHYCLPVLKREPHRQSLLQAAVSANPKFFLGTDSAPHARHTKETVCGCAGIYTAHCALELYAEAFAQAGALNKLEGFASFYGADFYALPRNTRRVTLVKQSWRVPETLPFAEHALVPFRAGEDCQWTYQT